MTTLRNQFTTEFKQECVNLVLNQGYSVIQAASLRKARGAPRAQDGARHLSRRDGG